MTHIKVGDKVKAVTANWSRTIGEVGTVEQVDSGSTCMPYRVRWSDDALLWHEAEHVELVAPAPAIPDEIEINGAKYRRVIEEAAPEKPEPKCGEIWRWDGELLLVTDEVDEDGDRKVVGIGGLLYGVLGYMQDRLQCEYVAPSLADALQRGLITATPLH